MALMLRAAQILGLLALLLSAWAPISQSLPMQYCAGLNTAPMAANLSIYQSNGLCSDFCRAKGYAFAIVQYQSCWCSNFVPDASTTVSTGRCDMVCPGFGDETCGASGLFGYIALGRAPSGTARASPSNTQGQSQDQTSAPQQTSDPQNSDPSGVPTAVQTVTADGTVRTVFITPTSGSQNAAGVAANQSTGGPSTGVVVGIVVGVIAFVVLSAGACFCIYIARTKRKQESPEDMPSQRGSPGGTAQSPRTEMKEGGLQAAVAGPWATGEGPGLGRRPSRLLPVDPRLDPFSVGIYTRSKSHESINTLRDDHDYSRKVHQPKVLRATNPDPDDD